MAEEQLPYDDPNLQLAQLVGKFREQKNPLSALDDSLIGQLLEYQTQTRLHRQNELAKQAVWAQIALSINQPSQKTSAKQSLINNRHFRWAAAAVILVAAMFSFLYVQYWAKTKLLAESKASIKTVQLSDGSTVTMRPHSKLLLLEESSSAAQYKLQGEALFEVSPQQQRTFSVQTKTGRVSVRGTRFVLSSWGNKMQVFLEEGSVEVQALQKDSTVVLHRGESAFISQNNHISRVENADAKEFTDWLNGQLIFESKPVREIIQELEQQFNISISLPKSMLKRRLSGQLSVKSLQVSLDDLTLVLGGTFVQTGKRSYRFERL